MNFPKSLQTAEIEKIALELKLSKSGIELSKEQEAKYLETFQVVTKTVTKGDTTINLEIASYNGDNVVAIMTNNKNSQESIFSASSSQFDAILSQFN